MSYFERKFQSKTKMAAPVLSTKDSWRDYLSKRETRELAQSERGLRRSGCVVFGSMAFKAGAMLLLTASVGSEFTQFVTGAANFASTFVMGAAGATGVYHWIQLGQLARGGKRREGDAEIAGRQNIAPFGLSR